MIESFLMDKYIDQGLDQAILNNVVDDFMINFPKSTEIGNVFIKLSRGINHEYISRMVRLSLKEIKTIETFIIEYLSRKIEEELNTFQKIPCRISFAK